MGEVREENHVQRRKKEKAVEREKEKKKNTNCMRVHLTLPGDLVNEFMQLSVAFDD